MYHNEISRSTYRLGCVLQDSGKIAEGRKEVMAAEKLRQDILGKEWTPAQSEKDFKGLVLSSCRDDCPTAGVNCKAYIELTLRPLGR